MAKICSNHNRTLPRASSSRHRPLLDGNLAPFVSARYANAMRLALLPVALVLFAGCASAPRPVAEAPAIRVPVVSTTRAVIPSRGEVTAPVAVELKDPRKAGDYVVHRFSGSFRKRSLLLAERVVSVEGPIIIIDFMLAEERGTKVEPGMHLRVKFDRTPGARREVAEVIRVVGERKEPGTLEDYEKLMAETIVVPDRNDDIIGSEIVKATVGDQSIDAKKTSYKVTLGKRQATLSTLSSDAFAWGDVGGEIRGTDGRIIYRAEVVETGSGRTPQAGKAASR